MNALLTGCNRDNNLTEIGKIIVDFFSVLEGTGISIELEEDRCDLAREGVLADITVPDALIVDEEFFEPI